MAVMKELNIPRSILNINGGACALGHPVGASGSRIIATLIYNLKNNNLKKELLYVLGVEKLPQLLWS